MSRAVFMSACGDPFLPLFCLKLFRENWYDEVDKFYIDFNNHVGVPKDVVSEFLAIASQDPKVHIIYHPEGIGNGRPITEMALIAKEEYVMLLEDDGFIFSKGVVDSYFKKLESGETDILGSPRGSCGAEVWGAAEVKYNLDYTGLGDKGPTWWPNFFFCKRADLLRTDMDFASKEYTKGTYFKEVDHTFETTEYSDTFAWASLQLRYLGLRSIDIPQCHAHPYDIESYDRSEGIFRDPRAKWIHGGSLSAGWGGYLSGRLPDVSADMAKQEIESRVAFWTIVTDVIKGFETFKDKYIAGIKDLIQGAKLSQTRIDKKIGIYKFLMQV